MPVTNRSLLNIFNCLFLDMIFMISCRTEQKEPVKTLRIDTIADKQKNPYSDIDQSPMDMAYYPQNYPQAKMNGADSSQLIARIIYSRPHRKNREIFGNSASSLCRYGQPWRLGANEATELELFSNITINGKNIPRATYILYCIPQEDKWTIVFNSNLHSWGLHMDPAKDVLRVDIPTMTQSPALEDFTMSFVDAAYGADLLMAWDNVKVQLPMEFRK